MMKVPTKGRFSVVIPTIGRSTLGKAIDSCLRERCDVVVVADGVDVVVSKSHDVQYLRLGMNYGRMGGEFHYGEIASTVGVFMSRTPFAMLMGDDDEMAPGAGAAINKKLLSEPDVDIWIPGIRYDSGKELCMNDGKLYMGNVSHPCFRTSVFAFEPHIHIRNENAGIGDYFHIKRCSEAGWKIRWVGEVCILIRPVLGGLRGNGEMG